MADQQSDLNLSFTISPRLLHEFASMREWLQFNGWDDTQLDDAVASARCGDLVGITKLWHSYKERPFGTSPEFMMIVDYFRRDGMHPALQSSYCASEQDRFHQLCANHPVIKDVLEMLRAIAVRNDSLDLFNQWITRIFYGDYAVLMSAYLALVPPEDRLHDVRAQDGFAMIELFCRQLNHGQNGMLQHLQNSLSIIAATALEGYSTCEDEAIDAVSDQQSALEQSGQLDLNNLRYPMPPAMPDLGHNIPCVLQDVSKPYDIMIRAMPKVDSRILLYGMLQLIDRLGDEPRLLIPDGGKRVMFKLTPNIVRDFVGYWDNEPIFNLSQPIDPGQTLRIELDDRHIDFQTNIGNFWIRYSDDRAYVDYFLESQRLTSDELNLLGVEPDPLVQAAIAWNKLPDNMPPWYCGKKDAVISNKTDPSEFVFKPGHMPVDLYCSLPLHHSKLNMFPPADDGDMMDWLFDQDIIDEDLDS